MTKCHGLKFEAKDGKMRLTDVADIEAILRLIQSIPSPKAEPFKLWLAKVGYERLKEKIKIVLTNFDQMPPNLGWYFVCLARTWWSAKIWSGGNILTI